MCPLSALVPQGMGDAPRDRYGLVRWISRFESRGRGSPGLCDLAQTPRGVWIQPLRQRQVEGEHLRRDRVKYRGELFRAGARHEESRRRPTHQIPVVAYDRYLGSPIREALHKGGHPPARLARRDDRDHWEIPADHGQGPMPEVRSRKRVGDHVGRFHQLEGRLRTGPQYDGA